MTNSKSTKRSLLMSAMSMLLCVSMLLGTTFAWFTDTVTSANNIIKSGNLDIELDYWDGDSWETVQNASEILTNKLWEPGVTEVAYLRVANEGSLALKYQLGVNIVSEKTGTNVAGDKFKLSDYIYFDVVEGVDGEKTPYTRETVKDVTTQKTKISAGYTKVSEMEAGSKPHYLALVVHMPTTVTNEANHNGEDIPEIALGINVFADQLTSESDSFGNDYDDLAFVPVANVDFLDDTNITLSDDTTMDLDVAYSFKTTEDEVAAAASGYQYWHADFVVSASKNVAANSIALAGYYDAYAQATNTVGKWIALEPDSDIAANTQIRLLEYMGVTGNYEELCQYIPEFLCGAIDLDGSNYGNTLTVELRLYETYSEEECLEIFGYKSKNEETGEYITIGKFEHTFGREYPVFANTAEELNDALANAQAGTVITLAENVDYGTVTVDELKNVVINGADDSTVIFKTDANTIIENVTLKDVNFEYTGATLDCGVVIDKDAKIDNLVVEGATFTGTGAKAGRGLSGYNNDATISLKDCTFKDIGYPIYAWGGYESLTIDNCTFDNIKSWAIMPQSGFDGDLTVSNCKFINCLGGGLIKAGTLTAGHKFTFTNNTITGCTIAGDHNWFQFNASAGTTVIENNTKDGQAWTPGIADGLK